MFLVIITKDLSVFIGGCVFPAPGRFIFYDIEKTRMSDL